MKEVKEVKETGKKEQGGRSKRRGGEGGDQKEGVDKQSERRGVGMDAALMQSSQETKKNKQTKVIFFLCEENKTIDYKPIKSPSRRR